MLKRGLGAGAGSELVAISKVYSEILKAKSNENNNMSCLNLHIQDVADYSSVLSLLECTIRNELSLTPSNFQTVYKVFDILSPLSSDSSYIQSADLISAFYLLNELFTTSKKSTLLFIARLLSLMKSGAYFFVIDSAGSFSHVSVGTNDRNYMIFTVLDGLKGWKCVYGEDSKWFRYSSGSERYYPRRLQNMRQMIRLYQKL